jgi:hypothetical protein
MQPVRLRRAVAAALALPFFVTPRASASPAQDDHTKTFADYGLTLTFPAEFTALKDRKASGQVKGSWGASLSGANVSVVLYVLPNKEFGFAEPEDVSEIVLENMRESEGGDPSFGYEKTLLVPGPFGYAPYGAIGYGAVHKKDSTEIGGTLFVLGGLLKEHGYSLEVSATPALPEADAKVVLDFLKKGVVYKGDLRVAKWTDEEAKARWMSDAPEATHKKLEPILRTEHYLLLTNSAGGKEFGKKMEENYTAIKKTFPFDEVPGRKLLLLFVFRTPDEYYDFYSKVHKVTRKEAELSKGHASGDYYATWWEAPNDPVHIHEGTHQIFRNRLRLGGGGSWFQEGVAEYMSTKPNERNVSARLVKTGKHMPLAEFVKMKSLLYSSNNDDVKGSDQAHEMYLQAALFIEFLRESKWGKEKFQSAVHALGNAPRNNFSAIERAFRNVYGTDVGGVEAQWIAYCKTR